MTLDLGVLIILFVSMMALVMIFLSVFNLLV